MRIHLASNNAKKLKELRRILDGAGLHGVEIVPLSDVPPYPEPVEDAGNFAGNAIIKARAGVEATGLLSIADDSGLCVDALNGMPGVLSARWSGSHGDDAANNALLLSQMEDVPDGKRGAAFVSTCALAIPDGEVVVSEGRWEGTILRACQGENGFGYDPLFSPMETPGRSAAELSADEKDALSHRGKALAGLVPEIAKLVR
ncbi:RdgB/HAM1 family non-canonical purine NTP pyrophosphatase [Corynebacterium uropygiale]|uniref:dITP/XTP pyrophosphatase n=1 Tax=Corynebacterium uropygiale TaxID=1775911 RepID=A0A9X1QQI0_9CORY|nr:RdgB/HAM1 family non-canonical purine NTP pyrophosphatase [Corynebacterium uropygiale]MCF4007434.1 RdgB/HAM1 family non-canonical purine NTP pyrophosphatase [Corynebacterium uropygiale]